MKKLRGKESYRDAAKRAGISHTYLSVIEKGIDVRSGSPVNPTPETLKALAKAYNHSYDDLMIRAGYMESKKESLGPLIESEIDRIINQAENHYNVTLRDDPDVVAALEAVIQSIARAKQK